MSALNKMFRYFLTSLFLVIFYIFLWPSVAIGQSPCSDMELGKLPILANGRVKPLTVHSFETLKAISGKAKRSMATQNFCKLSFFEPLNLSIRVDHVELKEKLGMDTQQKSISIDKVLPFENDLTSEMHQMITEKNDKTSYGKALNQFLLSLQTYRLVIDGRSWTIPIATSGPESDWVSLSEFRSEQVVATPKKTIEAIKKAGQNYLQKVESTVPLENTYYRLNFISYKVLFSFLALIIVFLVQKRDVRTQFWIGGLACGLVLILGAIDLTFRIIISGRGPVTNMYETVLWVGMGITLFATLLAFVKRKPVYFLFGLVGMVLTTFMNRFAPAMVDPSIQPLVPVLRDNFWLSTHVTTVTISYAAFALSWLIANYYLIKSIIKGPQNVDAKENQDLAYAAIKIGVVLLAAGIILGGVWADYSWGRFWGWDPKETWSLIALLIYVAILHGRYAGWIKPKQFLPFISLAFLSILMCWFGVNYILAAGLHSYGFSENGTIFLVSIFSLQIILFVLHYFRNQRPLTKPIS